MALFRLLEERDEFASAYCSILGQRLILNRTAVSNQTEACLLSKLTSTCGPSFTMHFERMLADVNDCKQIDSEGSVTLLTGGNWLVRDERLLPGHSILANANSFQLWPRPDALENFQTQYTANQANRSRRLTWIPQLSEVVFAGENGIQIRSTCLQFALLERIAEDKPLSDLLQMPFAEASLNVMMQVGLVARSEGGNYSFLAPSADVDVFTPVISRLFGQHPSDSIVYSSSTTPGPRSTSTRTFTPHNNNNHRPTSSVSRVSGLSKADRLTLLQSQISRLLKQLRSLSLAELYNRLSMLPVLLSRFSPSLEEVNESVRSLVEKEFVELVSAETGEVIADGEIDSYLTNWAPEALQVRYLA